MEIANNVIKLECTKGAYAYAILDSGCGVTLIDTGLPHKGELILNELNTFGVEPKNIKQILLTHHDIDHISNAAFIQERCGCEIYISKEDYPYMMGIKKRHGIKKVLGSLMKVTLPKTIKCFGAEQLDSIQIVVAPGHTPGHTCFRYHNVLFIGDLLGSKNGKLTLPPSVMNWSREELLKTLSILSVEGVEWLCPAHGEPVTVKDAWHAFRSSLGFQD